MRLHLTLYIAGPDTVRSVGAKRRLDSLLSRLNAEVYLDVVDVLDDPEAAERASIFATPTLVRDLPPPSRRVIGDLSDPAGVTAALGLNPYLTPEIVA